MNNISPPFNHPINHPSIHPAIHPAIQYPTIFNMARKSQQSTLFHRLPPELRVKIYHHVISDFFPLVQRPNIHGETGPKSRPALRLICKKADLIPPLLRLDQIFLNEAMPIILSRPFYFSSLAVVRQFTPAERRYITQAGVRVINRIATSTVRFDSACSRSQHLSRCLKDLRQQLQSILKLMPNIERLKVVVDLDPELSRSCVEVSPRRAIVEAIKSIASLPTLILKMEVYEQDRPIGLHRLISNEVKSTGLQLEETCRGWDTLLPFDP